MEIHQLRYFVAVAEEGSFSRAAAREHVAQPSLSQQIQKLEFDVGERLFDRLPRSIVLTEAGKHLLDYARRVLLEMTNARRCLDDLKRNVSGHLTVGAILTIAPFVLPALIEKFQNRYPNVTLEIFEDATENLALRLEDGTLDLALVSSCNESPALQRDSLGNEPLLLLLSREHPLAKRTKVKWSDLKSQKFLLLHEMHCLSAQICELLEANHLRPQLAANAAQLATIAKMVGSGLGVTLVPQMMTKSEFTSGCVALPFAPPVPVRELNMLRNPLRLESRAAAAFREQTAAAFTA
ncbi:MAG TPA: LysR family transcriptional regulator [Terriglobales bacterium]|nr:LysR family transcriptional regulator [Terriglobales bacterium]